MNARKLPLLLTAVALTLAACGTSDSESSTTANEPDPVTTDAAAPATPAGEASDEPPATEAAATQPASTDAAADAPADPPATEPLVAETPPAEATPAAIGGRVLAPAVEPASQFEANPFPDLVVADVGRGGEANIANVLPSTRPVLLWAWAPH